MVVSTAPNTYLQGNPIYVGTGAHLLIDGRPVVIGTPFRGTLDGVILDPETVKFAALHESGATVHGVYGGASDPALTWSHPGTGIYLVTWLPALPGTWTYSLFAEGTGQASAMGTIVVQPNPLLF